MAEEDIRYLELLEVTDRGLLLLLLRDMRSQSNTLREIQMSQTTAIDEIGVLSAKFDTLQTAVTKFANDAASVIATIKTGTLSAEAMAAATELEQKLDALTTAVGADDAALNPTSGGDTTAGGAGSSTDTTGGAASGADTAGGASA